MIQIKVRGVIDKVLSLFQFMAWCWTGDKPLPEPMMTQFNSHISISKSLNVLTVTLKRYFVFFSEGPGQRNNHINSLMQERRNSIANALFYVFLAPTHRCDDHVMIFAILISDS